MCVTVHFSKALGPCSYTRGKGWLLTHTDVLRGSLEDGTLQDKKGIENLEKCWQQGREGQWDEKNCCDGDAVTEDRWVLTQSLASESVI